MNFGVYKMVSKQRCDKGMTLTETVIAILILSIVIIGVSYGFVYSTNQIHLRNSYRTAALLASQKIEQLKADDYDNITEGSSSDETTLANVLYTRTVNTQFFANFKRIDLTVNWQRMNKQCDISMTTLIAP